VKTERMARWVAPAVPPILLAPATAWVLRYLHVLDLSLFEDGLPIVPRAGSGAFPGVARKPNGEWANASMTRASVSEPHETH
jgi:hypothetical protein